MRILIITDLEGVNGVLNFPDWCVPSGLRNETACRFLTEEVNAAVDGFFAGGASEVIVLDGHGSGGSIRGEILDQRAALQRGGADFPIMNRHVDAIALIGQHARAGSANAHLAHTQTEEAVYLKINDVEIGEFGQFACAYRDLNIPTIFAAGDLALTQEAQDLVANIRTVAVKEGINEPLDSTCSAEQLFSRESAAIHYPRQQVLAALRSKAADAAKAFAADPQSFKLHFPVSNRYHVEALYRATSPKIASIVGELPARKIVTDEFSTASEAISSFYKYHEWGKIDNKYVFEA